MGEDLCSQFLYVIMATFVGVVQRTFPEVCISTGAGMVSCTIASLSPRSHWRWVCRVIRARALYLTRALSVDMGLHASSWALNWEC